MPADYRASPAHPNIWLAYGHVSTDSSDGNHKPRHGIFATRLWDWKLMSRFGNKAAVSASRRALNSWSNLAEAGLLTRLLLDRNSCQTLIGELKDVSGLVLDTVGAPFGCSIVHLQLMAGPHTRNPRRLTDKTIIHGAKNAMHPRFQKCGPSLYSNPFFKISLLGIIFFLIIRSSQWSIPCFLFNRSIFTYQHYHHPLSVW